MYKKRLISVAVAAALVTPLAAHATNGYFTHGYGTKNKGVGGAGVALAQDAMAAATNPAAMVFVGDRMDLGAGIFSPMREYTVTGAPSGAPGSFGLAPGTVESDSNYFLIPHFARNWMLDSDSSLGLTVYGNGGMNTDYPASAGGGFGTFGAGGTGVDLLQAFINGTYARKIDDTSSWGVSAIVAIQSFEARGLTNFGGFSSDATKLTNNNHDESYGFGVKLGWMGEVADKVTLGASYQSKMSMSEFDDYAGLFAEQGDFDIPATATIGLSFEATPTSKVVFDIQQIWYSDIASIANPIMPNLMNAMGGDATALLGGDNGPGFGWDDITVYKLGYQWQTGKEWTWRVGYNHGDQPIPTSEVLFNILAPGVIEDHVTFGFTRQIDDKNEFSFAAMYAFENTVSGANPLDPGQTIELAMDQFELEASWGWKF